MKEQPNNIGKKGGKKSVEKWVAKFVEKRKLNLKSTTSQKLSKGE